MRNITKLIIIMMIFVAADMVAQQISSSFKIARVKYSGGGDWYNDPASEIELLKYVQRNTNLKVEPVYEFVDLSTDKIFDYPFLFLTGHGNVNFTDSEVRRLRAYLQNGGFLYIDDDYGLDPFIRKEMKKVFPDQEFAELPFSHGIFNAHFKFPNGVPKVNEHDGKKPQTFGLFYRGRLCVVFTYETNPSDGWAPPDIHKTPPDKRELAFKFGTNLIVWALSN